MIVGFTTVSLVYGNIRDGLQTVLLGFRWRTPAIHVNNRPPVAVIARNEHHRSLSGIGPALPLRLRCFFIGAI